MIASARRLRSFAVWRSVFAGLTAPAGAGNLTPAKTAAKEGYTMNHRLMATAAITLAAATASPAFAQDFETPWSGFYVGGNLGLTWGDTSSRLQLENRAGSRLPTPDVAGINQLSSDDDNDTGFAGSLEAGYNYLIGNVLIGIETDIGFLDIEETTDKTYQSGLLITPPITYRLQQKVGSDWVWTVRPRLGYVSGPWLFFASAGIAVSDVKIDTTYSDTFSPPGSASSSGSDTKTGFAGGLGVGYALGPNWSAKGEWLYTDFGKVRATSQIANTPAAITAEGEVKANILRVGVDYRF